jgi:hypothetical protein
MKRIRTAIWNGRSLAGESRTSFLGRGGGRLFSSGLARRRAGGMKECSTARSRRQLVAAINVLRIAAADRRGNRSEARWQRFSRCSESGCANAERCAHAGYLEGFCLAVSQCSSHAARCGDTRACRGLRVRWASRVVLSPEGGRGRRSGEMKPEIRAMPAGRRPGCRLCVRGLCLSRTADGPGQADQAPEPPLAVAHARFPCEETRKGLNKRGTGNLPVEHGRDAHATSIVRPGKRPRTELL